jgi:hypothetical protein
LLSAKLINERVENNFFSPPLLSENVQEFHFNCTEIAFTVHVQEIAFRIIRKLTLRKSVEWEHERERGEFDSNLRYNIITITTLVPMGESPLRSFHFMLSQS